MKRLSFATLMPVFFFMMHSASSAQAQIQNYSTSASVVAVKDQTLHLLGRGYFDRRDPTQMFALACIEVREDQQCSQARFVFWKGKEAFFVRQGFYLRYEDDKNGAEVLDLKDFKKTIEEILQYTTWNNRDTRSARLLVKVVGTAAITMGIIAGMPFFGAFYVPLLLTSQHGIDAYGSTSISVSFENMITVVSDQSGWNWSSHPKSMNRKAFESITRDLNDTTQYMWNETPNLKQPNPIP